MKLRLKIAVFLAVPLAMATLISCDQSSMTGSSTSSSGNCSNPSCGGTNVNCSSTPTTSGAACTGPNVTTVNGQCVQTASNMSTGSSASH